MDDKIYTSLILLTYKGKALLMSRTNSAIDPEEHGWSLIGGVKKDDESFEEAMSRRVEKETSIRIETIEFLSKYCYLARLTDDNVNNIKRDERQLLDFFSPRDLQKLNLLESTKLFMIKYGSLI